MRSVVQHPARQPDVGPAELREHLVSLDVGRPALRVGPVMGTFEVDAHQIFLPAHIDSSDDEAVRVEPGKVAGLARRDPVSESLFADKGEARKFVEERSAAIDALQDRLWAERSRALLVVLQGMDTSGKDGTVRAVFNACGPIGVRVTAFGRPSEVDLAHDYLWRVHAAAPAKGTIGVFNRSHYEDVLVVRVRGLAPAAAIERRYDQINAFEKHLAENGTTIRIGAGGIMLPNHAPLVIAEQFGTLDALFPGRIDLGLGRAPGSDQKVARALRRTLESSADAFPQDIVELQSYFEPVQPGQRVQAVPGAGLKVPIWILGSSLFGAQLAAALGLPYAFASHFAPGAMMQAIEVYRRSFQPSPQQDRPYVMLGFNVIAADSDEEARYLSTSRQQASLSMRRGRPTRLPPPADHLAGVSFAADPSRPAEIVRAAHRRPLPPCPSHRDGADDPLPGDRAEHSRSVDDGLLRAARRRIACCHRGDRGVGNDPAAVAGRGAGAARHPHRGTDGAGDPAG